jgi:O-antigen/teichoic acid export membrane protein
MKITAVKNKGLRDLGYTLGANIISLASGLLATFAIPKLLSIEEYAYLRVFTLYLGYLGVFHFGFNDGVYINYGKQDYEHLPRESFRAYFRFLVLFQCLMAVLAFGAAAILLKDKSRIYIYMFLSINIVLTNIIGYFDLISQFVRRFKVYSFNLVLSKLLYILGVVTFLFINNNKAIYFIALQTVVNLIILYIYLMRYKDIVFGEGKTLREAKKGIKSNIAVGFFIMFGNFITITIIGIDRIFVEKFFSVTEFAMYSFAVSLLSMFYLVINSITTVVYPYLTRSEDKNKGKTYETMKSVIFILIGFCLSGYFVFDIIVRVFIPQYTAALTVTAIIFPTILLSSEINIVTQNFYKTQKLQKAYTRNNIIVAVIALLTIVAAFFLFKSVIAIAVCSLISFFIWEIYGDVFFKKILELNTTRHFVAEILTIGIFIYLALNVKWYFGFIIYITSFIAITFIFFKRDIKALKNMLLKRS